MNPRTAAARGGFVAAACVACCAPPIIAALGVTAGLAASAAVFVGLAAAIAVVLLGVGWIIARRTGSRRAAPEPPVIVMSPTRRAPDDRHGRGPSIRT